MTAPVRWGEVPGTPMSVPRIWRVTISAALAGCLIACGPVEAPPPPATASPPNTLRLLYLAPAPAATAAFLPAYRGAEVALAVAALEGANVDLRWVEVPEPLGDWRPPAADAAIVAPMTRRTTVAQLASLLAIPTVSLAGGRPDGHVRALLAGDRALAEAMLAEAGDAPCLVADRSGRAFAMAFRRPSAGTAPARLRAGAVRRDPRLVAGCSGVLWPGTGVGGASIRRRLAAAGLRGLAFIGSDRLRDEAFAEAAGRTGRGVVVVSGAADVATRLDLSSRRFIQDYQAEVGIPPAPFSVEGWDAATLLLSVAATGWPSAFTGVARRYALTPPIRPTVSVVVLTAAGWRRR